MLRLSAKGLGLCAALVLLAHAVLLARSLPAPDPSAEAWLSAGLLLAYGLAGRVALSFLPPGEVGSHLPRALPATLATSFVLGSLIASLAPALSIHPLWSVPFLALLRWFTLPGAMVPRHLPPSEPYGILDTAAALAGTAWSVSLFVVEDPRFALTWLALCVLVFHALGVARRRRAGRYALLAVGAALAPHGLSLDLAPAVGLGLGASFLVPWLRRADKRAGVLSMLGFGSVFCSGPTLLGLVGPSVLLFFSHPRQRRFAGPGAALSALLFLGVWSLTGDPAPARGRLLWLPELLDSALDTSVWGLAWPAVLVALGLGALAFDWRASDWSVGTIEEPRREAKALLALVLLAFASLAPTFSPWGEEEVLAILYLPCALLAGLLLIPAERAPAPA